MCEASSSTPCRPSLAMPSRSASSGTPALMNAPRVMSPLTPLKVSKYAILILRNLQKFRQMRKDPVGGPPPLGDEFAGGPAHAEPQPVVTEQFLQGGAKLLPPGNRHHHPPPPPLSRLL